MEIHLERVFWEDVASTGIVLTAISEVTQMETLNRSSVQNREG